MTTEKYWHRALRGALSAHLDWLAISLIGGGYLQHNFGQDTSKAREERPMNAGFRTRDLGK